MKTSTGTAQPFMEFYWQPIVLRRGKKEERKRKGRAKAFDTFHSPLNILLLLLNRLPNRETHKYSIRLEKWRHRKRQETGKKMVAFYDLSWIRTAGWMKWNKKWRTLGTWCICMPTARKRKSGNGSGRKHRKKMIARLLRLIEVEKERRKKKEVFCSQWIVSEKGIFSTYYTYYIAS